MTVFQSRALKCKPQNIIEPTDQFGLTLHSVLKARLHLHIHALGSFVKTERSGRLCAFAFAGALLLLSSAMSSA